MAVITSFSDRLAKKNEAQEMHRLISFFKEQFGGQSNETLMAIANALESGDIEHYKSITEPIIYRNIIREVNKTPHRGR